MSLQARRLQRRKSAYTPFPLGDPNTVRAGGTVTYDLSGTNITRDTSQLIRYTRTATQTTTPTNMYCVEIVVSLSTNKVISVNNPVSYTHLDVYKRQSVYSVFHLHGSIALKFVINGIAHAILPCAAYRPNVCASIECGWFVNKFIYCSETG